MSVLRANLSSKAGSSCISARLSGGSTQRLEANIQGGIEGPQGPQGGSDFLYYDLEELQSSAEKMNEFLTTYSGLSYEDRVRKVRLWYQVDADVNSGRSQYDYFIPGGKWPTHDGYVAPTTSDVEIWGSMYIGWSWPVSGTYCPNYTVFLLKMDGSGTVSHYKSKHIRG